jgi:two-component system, LytTR family, response regulator
MMPAAPIRALVIDDEPIARRRIRRFLRSENNVEVVGECTNGREAIDAIREHSPDLVFLDVQMPDVDGFGVVSEVGADRMPAVIFVTAYDEYALRAFEVHAMDYLLKPFDAERFKTAFQRARAHIERVTTAEAGRRLKTLLEQVLSDDRIDVNAALQQPAAAPASRHLDRLMVKSDGRVFFVRVADVDYFEASGNYVRVHVGKTSHLIRETMSGIESSLNPSMFARIHRAVIVNLDRIRELQPWFAGDYIVILRDGRQLKLSRTYREQLQARMHRIP